MKLKERLSKVLNKGFLFIKTCDGWFIVTSSAVYDFTHLWMVALGIFFWSVAISLFFPGTFLWVLIILAIIYLSGEALTLVLLDHESFQNFNSESCYGRFMNMNEDKIFSAADFLEHICQMDKVIGAMLLPLYVVLFFFFSLTASVCITVDKTKERFAKQ
jgi:hypothetical protein